MNTFRTIKLLALAALALVALGAVSAAGAQAGTFTAGGYPATITGTNTELAHAFTTEVGVIECAPTFHGKLESASEELTLTPSYANGCKLGATEVDVNVYECDFRLHAGAELAVDTFGGTLDICPEGGAIEFVVTRLPMCQITVEEQLGLSTLMFTERTVAKDVDLDFVIEGLSYFLDLGCDPKLGEFSNGSYGGITTLRADKGGAGTSFGVD